MSDLVLYVLVVAFAIMLIYIQWRLMVLRDTLDYIARTLFRMAAKLPKDDK